MSKDLLQTKLNIPFPRVELVARPRLRDQMNVGLSHRLTLVSAPAGFGKTTLVADWANELDLPIAWLSLDEGDNELSRFVTYTVAALQQIDPELGQDTLRLLQMSEKPSSEAIITLLINQLDTLEQKILLVLDDYHVINNLDVHQAVSLLIEQLPSYLHLIILSRTDPPFPLARLRVRQQMTEIRDKELRFTEAEATAFFNKSMSLELPPDDVAALEARTEGWIAGLQLAALSLRGHKDKHQFVKNFAGSHRQVIDYLSEDVLKLQDERVQNFLLNTSILERLSGPLCDAVTSRNDSQKMLEELEQANLFIIPLDDERIWYRYHHLFADFLRIQLRHHQPEQSNELHQRAAGWYENNDLISEAVEHALSAKDFERASRLIEIAAETILWVQGQWTTLLRWLEALPNETIYAHPSLALFHAWALFITGQWNAVIPILPDVKKAISTVEQSAVQENMLGEVATVEACVIYETGNMDRCIELAHKAQALLAKNNLMTRGAANYVLGLAYFGNNNFEAAHQAYQDAVVESRQADNPIITLVATGSLVQLALKQGRLRQADELYRQAIQLGKQESGVVLGPVGVACVHMGEVMREWNQLESAEQILLEGIELCRQQQSMPEIVLEGTLTLARVQQASGDVHGAAEALSQAEDQLTQFHARSGDVKVIIFYVEISRVRLWLVQGNLAPALQWSIKHGLVDASESEAASPEHVILLARIYLAQDKLEASLRLLDQLPKKPMTENVSSVVIEILILRALALYRMDDIREALAALAQALSLAEPEGYIRLFVDEGDSMRQLLQQTATQHADSEYVFQLLSAFPTIEDRADKSTTQPHIDIEVDETNSRAKLLNGREREVLRFMAAGLSNPEIARELHLSINTIKWYTSLIYRKLGVKKRAEAVNQAHDLGIL